VYKSKKPDKDDYRKLERLVTYSRKSMALTLTLESDNLLGIIWWVDASYACHDNMRGQTGGMVSFGKGAMYGTSVKQKLSARSSTVAKLIAVHDVMPQIFWVRQFLIHQGITLHSNTLYQDNRSAMLLETNDRFSSRKNTCHIDIQYFHIKDKIEKGEVNLKYCKTEDMLAKPIQGNLFICCRDIILNTKYTGNGDAAIMQMT
jgi:hypothetical protein